MACWKTRPNCPCGRGSIVVCTMRDCRLVVLSGRRCVGVWKGKRHNLCFSSLRANEGTLACHMAPRLRLVWRRGPLTPVVVVGEGQVNLVSGRCSRCRCHGQSLQSFVVDDLMMNQIDQSSGCDSSCVSSPELA